jgi:hypothetical protein
MTNPATPPTPTAQPAASLKTLLFAVAILLVIVAACAEAGKAWLAEHDARVKAEASVATLQKSIESAATEKQQSEAEQKQRDRQAADTISKIAAAAAAVKTPAQILKYIPQQLEALGPLPSPITAELTPPTPQTDLPGSPGRGPGSPDLPPAVLSIPQDDLEAVKENLAACQTNAVAAPSAQQDVSSCEARAKLSAQQLADAQKQVQALQLELKGGTFWHRVKAGTKKVAIGVAIGAAAGVVLQCKTGHYK